MAEIEKLGQKYQVALRIVKDPLFERLPCTHKGNYADDCLVQRVTQHKCYIVATVDQDLKQRIWKIPGVPFMYISNHRYNIKHMPDDYGLSSNSYKTKVPLPSSDQLPVFSSLSML
ncbi:rRNA-processing protein FCF1-like protein [Heterocephalus glaber]|uniref:rRNA-processing protein FCF1-like protein n=1 Tax=Heterocephalus glaber TaxID=10181 RepID=G5BBY6_HETGA|nr:rRNA-processing protein FCF1-like protein [Heterocephalus glaber]